MEGFIDWNKLTIEQYIEHLENKYQFDSSGTAKAVFELIAAYRALTIHNVVGQSEQLKAFQKMVNETKGYTAISDELIDKHLKSL